MFWKYLIASLLGLIAVGGAILLIIFLASAALFGSISLTIISVAAVALFFYFVTFLNKEQESDLN